MKVGKPSNILSPRKQKGNFTHIDEIIDGLLLVGKNGYGDEYGIGSPESFSILEVAQMFEGKIEMLPERKGNRMTADVISAKTEALGWSPKLKLQDYTTTLKANNLNKV